MKQTEQRLRNLDIINDRWEHPDGTDSLIHNGLEKWVLVEERVHTGGGVFHLTLHKTAGDAAMYWQEQEEPGYWHPLCVVDLDTLDIYPGHIVSTVEFGDNGGQIAPLGLKKYRVGTLIEVWAENEEHAIEQFHNAVGEETPDANVVTELTIGPST